MEGTFVKLCLLYFSNIYFIEERNVGNVLLVVEALKESFILNIFYPMKNWHSALPILKKVVVENTSQKFHHIQFLLMKNKFTSPPRSDFKTQAIENSPGSMLRPGTRLPCFWSFSIFPHNKIVNGKKKASKHEWRRGLSWKALFDNKQRRYNSRVTSLENFLHAFVGRMVR